ncbi:BON domain-containing protein [Marinicella gelatinilytica]|uniref:BON domain-containing protein n=1 Tax=Marinicella gelatinilytica TaxID=2996017 RepID=UPI0022610299|nr:BON domain-containing protein [Marinicella gelatinilytica]MCX7545058.1 BON domain-containing protein [Marinicella gelatinilytica]
MKNYKTNKLRNAIRTTILAASLAVTPFVMADNSKYDADDKLRDAWLDGKVETALLVNRHLNNFEIDTDVKGRTVVLSGTVNSEIDKDLAGEIAKGIEGVNKVENNLVVEKPENIDYDDEMDDDANRSFSNWYYDSTTTAAIKSKLLWNGETSGLKVNVDTMYGKVTLKGNVSSSAEKDLVEKIAENTDGVRSVDNQLKVVQDS